MQPASVSPVHVISSTVGISPPSRIFPTAPGIDMNDKRRKNHDPAPEEKKKKYRSIKTSLFQMHLETNGAACKAPAILSSCQASCSGAQGLPLLPEEH